MLDFFDSKLYLIPEKELPNVDKDSALVILVHGTESDKNKAFVQAVLKPFGMIDGDYQLLFFENEMPAFAQLRKEINFDSFLVFGATAQMIGMQIAVAFYQPLTIMDTKMMLAESLELFLIEKEKAEASATKLPRPKARMLWESLKVFLKK